MLTKFLCWLLGHQFKIVIDRKWVEYGEVKITWRVLPHCFRCGCKNHGWDEQTRE